MHGKHTSQVDEELPLLNGFIGGVDDYIPELVDTKFILTGWRCNYSSRPEVFMTLFKWHNETINVWSHFLGALIFFSVIVSIYFSYPNMVHDAAALEQKFNEVRVGDHGIQM